MSGPLQQLLGVSSEQRAAEQAAKNRQIQALGELLDDPEVTLDAKDFIAQQLEDLTNVPNKKKGVLGLVTRIYHQQQQPQRRIPQNLYGNLDEQVAVGAPQEALSSLLQKMNQRVTQESDKSMGLEPSPLDYQREMVQPTARRGSLTTSQLKEQRGLETFKQEQGIKAEIDTANDERTRQRQTEVQRLRNEAAAARTKAVIEGQMKRLTVQEQLRAHRRGAELAAAYPDAQPEQIASMLQQEIELEQSNKKALRQLRIAQAKAIPERIAQQWQALDLSDIRTQIYEQSAMSQIDKREFDQRTRGLFNDLNNNRLEQRNARKYPNDLTMQQELQELQAEEQAILSQIYDEGESFNPTGAAVKGAFGKPTPQTKSPIKSRIGRGQTPITPSAIDSVIDRIRARSKP